MNENKFNRRCQDWALFLAGFTVCGGLAYSFVLYALKLSVNDIIKAFTK